MQRHGLFLHSSELKYALGNGEFLVDGGGAPTAPAEAGHLRSAPLQNNFMIFQIDIDKFRCFIS